MAFEEVEKAPEEKGIPKYWKPEQIGDNIEGNIFEFAESTFNGKKQVQINLYCGEDENEEPLMSLLPAHADLKRVYVNLNVGDYIRVEAVDKIQTENMNYPKWIYKVLVDPDRKVEWPDDDSDYEVETVTDDYYAE